MANTAADANLIVFDDPSLRRYTGHHGFRIQIPTRYVYAYDSTAVRAHHESVIQSMRKEKIEYVMLEPGGVSPEMREEDRSAIVSDWKSRADLVTVYQNRYFMIRRLAPVQSGM